MKISRIRQWSWLYNCEHTKITDLYTWMGDIYGVWIQFKGKFTKVTFISISILGLQTQNQLRRYGVESQKHILVMPFSGSSSFGNPCPQVEWIDKIKSCFPHRCGLHSESAEDLSQVGLVQARTGLAPFPGPFNHNTPHVHFPRQAYAWGELKNARSV